MKRTRKRRRKGGGPLGFLQQSVKAIKKFAGIPEKTAAITPEQERILQRMSRQSAPQMSQATKRGRRKATKSKSAPTPVKPNETRHFAGYTDSKGQYVARALRSRIPVGEPGWEDFRLKGGRRRISSRRKRRRKKRTRRRRRRGRGWGVKKGIDGEEKRRQRFEKTKKNQKKKRYRIYFTTRVLDNLRKRHKRSGRK